mgnify:CR=1 FL=1
MNGGDGNGWRIDKRVPVTVLGILLAQSVGFGIWVGAIDTKVEASETWIAETKLERVDARMSVLESQILDIRAALGRIEQRLGVLRSSDATPTGR